MITLATYGGFVGKFKLNTFIVSILFSEGRFQVQITGRRSEEVITRRS